MFEWLNFPVTHGFYPAYDPNLPDTPHYAVDIGTPFHTALTALKSGTVITADYAAWGGEIFVKPDDGSTEYYYYHLDENDVAPGQHVNAGDLVGYSGGENPGFPGAQHPADPIWSTGPHTHLGYFTNWTSTPDGTRPQGPDITPLIQDIKTGKTNPTQPTITPAPLGGGNLAQASVPSLPNVQEGLQSALVRIGLFLVVLVLFGGGLYIAFADQINSGVKAGVETAGKAVVLL